MNKDEAILCAVMATLADHHVNLTEVFETDEEKDHAQQVIATYESDILSYASDPYIDKYTQIAKEYNQKIIKQKKRKEFREQWGTGDDWGKGYVEMGLNQTEEELWSDKGECNEGLEEEK